MSRRTGTAMLAGLLIGAFLVSVQGKDEWRHGFQEPPDSAKPWCYWYWISDNVSKDGITRDLEAMAQVGIGEALIGNIYLDDVPPGRVQVLSQEWWALVEHAIREGGRTGVNIGMFNCPGWSQSGGPWIRPEQSMRYLAWSETRLTGPARFEGALPAPKQTFQDVTVMAFPAPAEDATHVEGVRNAGGYAFECPKSFTARSLSLIPTQTPWKGEGVLQVEEGNGYRDVKSFVFDRSNMAVGVGPMPQGPVVVSLPATTATHFRVVFQKPPGAAQLAGARLGGAPRIESVVEKQLGKMHPTPLPMWDTYLWPSQPEPDRSDLVISPTSIMDLSDKMDNTGRLLWNVPPGEWVVLRVGMTPTLTRNSPASAEGQGWEVDKMNRALARHHFQAFIGEILERMPADERTAFTRVVADSYEMGSQNWTDGFEKTFRQRYAYDPIPWLATLTGRIVGSAEQSDRFLWDLRRLVADHVAKDYVGGLRDLCRERGLGLWLENYGHWGFPAEFLQYGGQSDRIGGEFWVTGDLGSIECRAASSAANTYGFPIVSAEAFTGGAAFQTAPWGMKARGDWAFCEGINHFVLHVYIHQPWEDRKPGMNAWFGTEFNRHNTWFEASRPWIDYLRRSSYLLQQGTRVADAAYFIGEDTPKMTGVQEPPLPGGRDFDYINGEVILGQMKVEKGRLVLPHGTSYPLLILPELPTMRPEVLRRIHELVKDGATVLGPPPSRSPSLENYPACDAQVQELAGALWEDYAHGKPGEHRLGKGRVLWGEPLDDVFKDMQLPPDFQSEIPLRFTHRSSGNAHLYFVTNPKNESIHTLAGFRVTGHAPELWWPDSGRMERPAVYDEVDGLTQLPIQLGPYGSVFVVFHQGPMPGERLVSVSRNGTGLLDVRRRIPTPAAMETTVSSKWAGSFTLAMWVKPSADTTLHGEINQGVRGLSEPRNDVIFPTHGGSLGGEGHAGSGIAVGRNGVCVFEHAANYFVPILAQPARLDGWTHLALVYRENRPMLYLDGRLVRTGLQSAYTVHPGEGSVGPSFRGEVSDVRRVDRALTVDDLHALMKSMPKPDSHLPGPAVQLSWNAQNQWVGEFRESGTYVLQDAAGSRRTVTVGDLPPSLPLAGPWAVSFAMGPEVVFDTLLDWTRHPESSVQRFSGTAVYRKSFVVPPRMSGHRLELDLGLVRDLARVRINGEEVGTRWLAPWRFDVTQAIRGGENQLEVEIVNTWHNRLVGDAALPKGTRTTFLANPTVPPDAPLLSAGLMGPVALRAVQVETVLPGTTPPGANLSSDTQLPRAHAGEAEKPNVLFIAIDDLNDWIGCMGGHPQAKTPNIDRLAARGMLFSNAHCQSPVCNPSRASLMTSLYPATTGIYFLNPDLDQSPVATRNTLLPRRFEQEGYLVSGAGKLFHGGQNRKYLPNYAGSFGEFGPRPKQKLSSFPGHPLWDWGAFPERDEQMPDHKIAAWGVEQLEKTYDQPFFLALGFYRPHVPQYAPQKWFDMYPLESVKLPVVLENDLGDLSRYAINLTRLKHVSPPHEWVTQNQEWKPLVQSYLACTSFVDHQVGKVLAALDTSPYRDHTFIVLWTDHGFHLGEKERWAKRSLWEDGTRVPLIIAGPGVAKGRVCSKPVQLLDLYPTLLEVADLNADPRLEGHSMASLLADPVAEWPHMARTSFGPGNYSIRSERYRYIHYHDGSEEFYDHAQDPHEWKNLAGTPGMAALINQHRKFLPRTSHRILGTGSTGHAAYEASEAED